MAGDVLFVPDADAWAREFHSWGGIVGQHMIKVGKIHQTLSRATAPGPGKRPRNRTGIDWSKGVLENQIINGRGAWGIELEVRTIALPPYSLFVHNGTHGPYVIKPKKPGGVLVFRNRFGKKVFRKQVIHPGIRRTPFLAENLRRALST